MLSYVIRRILLLFPTLVGITLVVFTALAFSPGGIAGSILSRDGNMRPAERREKEDYITKRFGLKKPKPVQYLRWMNKISPVGLPTYVDEDTAVKEAVARTAKLPDLPDGSRPVPEPYTGDFKLGWPVIKMPDLGTSFIKGRPVVDLIAEALPITLMLNLVSLPVIYLLAIGTGIKAAASRDKAFDKISGTAFLSLWSFPVILAGTLCIGFLTSDQYVRLFPTNGLHEIDADTYTFLPTYGQAGFHRGYLLDTLWHLVLPVVCMSYGSFAVLSKLTRGAVLDNFGADYARTARAKGLGENEVLFRHVFRNSLLPLITVAASILPALIAGSIVVETIFGISGMGRLAVQAVQQKDPELVLSITLIGGLLGLIGNLIADIGYAVADPRVSYDG